MSSMQWSLLGLGVLVVLGVWFYNLWTTRRATPRHATPLNSPPKVAGIEPSLDDALGDDWAPPAEPADEVMQAFDAIAAPPQASTLHAAIDPLIDSVVVVGLSGPVSGEAILAAAPTTRRVGSKTLVIEGLDDSGEWSRPQAGHRYQGVQVALQLANRSGPINNIDFSEFVAKVQALADAINGAPEFPDMFSEVARAKELDQFASQHDAQLGVVLRAKSTAWSLGYVQHHAFAAGLVAGSVPGKLIFAGAMDKAPALFTLRFDTQVALNEDQDGSLRELRLILDVPQVNHSEEPFDQLCRVALELASAMDADLVDDVGQPLNPELLAQIGVELNSLYDALDERDLSAGSDLARRLFS